MPLHGRHGEASTSSGAEAYRYGFQGQEMTDEWEEANHGSSDVDDSVKTRNEHYNENMSIKKIEITKQEKET